MSDREQGSDPRGRLSVRPRLVSADLGPSGLHPVQVDGQPLGLLYAAPASGAGPRQLVLVLHGAAGTPQGALSLLHAHADEAGLLLLAPSSAGQTWDLIVGGYGPDVRRIDRCLTAVSGRYAIEPGSVAVAGFSDGASYALSLGVANGDLFDAVVAFSPGFLVRRVTAGQPRIFVSHGTADRVLPIERCGRPVARQLRQAGYDVAYVEFTGGHEVPAQIAAQAVRWLRPGPPAG